MGKLRGKMEIFRRDGEWACEEEEEKSRALISSNYWCTK
jgi:hypothetical protein